MDLMQVCAKVHWHFLIYNHPEVDRVCGRKGMWVLSKVFSTPGWLYILGDVSTGRRKAKRRSSCRSSDSRR